MRQDLHKTVYHTEEEYKNYIYGSADVVGLMCLKVFVNGDSEQYNALKQTAMALGSAFQKVNFLRDLKADHDQLNRTYFPNTDLNNLDELSKQAIIDDIENDFSEGLKGIKQLPLEAKFGVFMAYRYYNQLLKKLKITPALEIKSTRIRVPDYKKVELLTRSYVKYQLNLL
jgi:phytoene synthase